MNIESPFEHLRMDDCEYSSYHRLPNIYLVMRNNECIGVTTEKVYKEIDDKKDNILDTVVKLYHETNDYKSIVTYYQNYNMAVQELSHIKLSHDREQYYTPGCTRITIPINNDHVLITKYAKRGNEFMGICISIYYDNFKIVYYGETFIYKSDNVVEKVTNMFRDNIIFERSGYMTNIIEYLENEQKKLN